MGAVMSTTHTPAPWRADKLPSGDYRIIYNATKNWLAKVYCDGESDAAKADARLIAAAPELLAALKFTLTDPCFVLLGSVTKDEVYAAIAKATGSDQ
jgi:hypothetical protein